MDEAVHPLKAMEVDEGWRSMGGVRESTWSKRAGPGCTRISKVKGHATQGMVDERKAQKEEKKGNDQADTGAERGAVTMQKVTQKLAGLYSWRHGGYRNLLIRIQRFIVGLKNHDRQPRKEEKKKAYPLWGRRKGEYMHTEKVGACRPGGRD